VLGGTGPTGISAPLSTAEAPPDGASITGPHNTRWRDLAPGTGRVAMQARAVGAGQRGGSAAAGGEDVQADVVEDGIEGVLVPARDADALAGAGAVEVAKKGGGADLITCRNVVIATGSSAAVPPVPGFDLEGVITSDGALELGEPPAADRPQLPF